MSLKKIIEDLDLQIVYESSEIDSIKVVAEEVNRPGLQLAGYFKKFAYERIQIIGNVEWYYLSSLDKSIKYERLSEILKYDIPCVIMARDLEYSKDFYSLAQSYDRTLLKTGLETTKFINKLLNYLDYQLSAEDTVHGVLIEVYGMGVLIIGDSGIGKSETALELIKKGHRLVSDDSVDIKKSAGRLIGRSPQITQHFMEIRGLGILDIERLYGVGAVKEKEFIDLVVQLEKWDESKEYDRLGLDEQYIEILDVKVPLVVTPVKPGRNLSMLVEVAAKNTRQKRLGYNAALNLSRRIESYIKEK